MLMVREVCIKRKQNVLSKFSASIALHFASWQMHTSIGLVSMGYWRSVLGVSRIGFRFRCHGREVTTCTVLYLYDDVDSEVVSGLSIVMRGDKEECEIRV